VRTAWLQHVCGYVGGASELPGAAVLSRAVDATAGQCRRRRRERARPERELRRRGNPAAATAMC
jgi:hypothetical protein